MLEQEDIVVQKFNGAQLMKQMRMPMIAIYKKPKDYPTKYVARVWNLNQPTRLVALGDTYAEIRAVIPEGMCCIGRTEKDDPVIVEVWI